VRSYLVLTDHGLVRVTAREGVDGLDPDFLDLAVPEEDLRGQHLGEQRGALDEAVVPLRAFGAKVLEWIEAESSLFSGSDRLRRLMVQEKASSDLNRIERWAKARRDAGR
jgi:hypothetical protein